MKIIISRKSNIYRSFKHLRMSLDYGAKPFHNASIASEIARSVSTGLVLNRWKITDSEIPTILASVLVEAFAPSLRKSDLATERISSSVIVFLRGIKFTFGLDLMVCFYNTMPCSRRISTIDCSFSLKSSSTASLFFMRKLLKTIPIMRGRQVNQMLINLKCPIPSKTLRCS
jgi:hypothetical protein